MFLYLLFPAVLSVLNTKDTLNKVNAVKRVSLLFVSLLLFACMGCWLTTADALQSMQPDASAVLSPTPVATPAFETPDRAGKNEVLFDIYRHRAECDLNKDGTNEQIELEASASASKILINGVPYIIDLKDLAQLFAITDINPKDNILELVFTEKYRELSGEKKVYSYLYWWNGTKLSKMGGLMDVKFDGSWRTGFDPVKYFDAKGTVTCLAKSNELTAVWYQAHYVCSGANRILKEEAYTTTPIGTPNTLKLKHQCVLLKKISSKYFTSDFSVMWDYASGYATVSRDFSDDAVAFIPQANEQLKVVNVYGQYWFKLKAIDGKAGWLKCIDGNVQGYSEVMHNKASDIFSGL